MPVWRALWPFVITSDKLHYTFSPTCLDDEFVNLDHTQRLLSSSVSSYMPTRKSLWMPCFVHTVQRQKEGSMWSETVLGDEALGLMTAWKLLLPWAKLNNWLSLCNIRFVNAICSLDISRSALVWCSVRKSCIVSLACDIRAVPSTGGKDRFSFLFGYESFICREKKKHCACTWSGVHWAGNAIEGACD